MARTSARDPKPAEKDSPVITRRVTRASSRSAARNATSTNQTDVTSSQNSTQVKPEQILGPNGTPLGSDHAPGTSKLSSFLRRFWTTVLMIAAYAGAIHLGQPALLLVVMTVQFMMYKEIVRLAYTHLLTKEETSNIPLFRTQNWFWFGSAMFLIHGKVANNVFGVNIPYHTFICFMLLIIAFVGFVLSLKRGSYRVQFSMFAWAFITIIIIVLQPIAIVYNMFEGLIWFVLPTVLVASNDTWAYVWGMLFGRTSLLELSPKKTWEGFIGALFCTCITAFFASRIMTWYPILTCPQNILTFTHPECTLNPIFVPVNYVLPWSLPMIGNVLSVAPIQIHALIMGVFASLVAPFGGFFASGFKRAYKIKDFGDLIPGHGGLTDRMDCQLLMGTFVYVYYNTFINPESAICACAATVPNIISMVKTMSATEKQQILQYLKSN